MKTSPAPLVSLSLENLDRVSGGCPRGATPQPAAPTAAPKLSMAEQALAGLTSAGGGAADPMVTLADIIVEYVDQFAPQYSDVVHAAFGHDEAPAAQAPGFETSLIAVGANAADTALSNDEIATSMIAETVHVVGGFANDEIETSLTGDLQADPVRDALIADQVNAGVHHILEAATGWMSSNGSAPVGQMNCPVQRITVDTHGEAEHTGLVAQSV